MRAISSVIINLTTVSLGDRDSVNKHMYILLCTDHGT